MGIGGKKTLMEILASRSHTTRVSFDQDIDQLRKLSYKRSFVNGVI